MQPPPPGAPPGGPQGWGAPPGAPPQGPVGGWGTALPPGVNPYTPGNPTGGTQTEPMGIIALVLGIVSVPVYFCCGPVALAANIVGLVLGFVSINRCNNEPQRYQGKGLAIAALVINALFLILNLVMIEFFFGLMGVGLLSGP